MNAPAHYLTEYCQGQFHRGRAEDEFVVPELLIRQDDGGYLHPSIAEEYRYYAEIPKQTDEHLDWREWVLAEAAESKSFQRREIQRCREDLLYYINTYAWTFNPKNVKHDKPLVLPFNTYPYQDLALHEMRASWGEYDLLIEKSRDMGASWMMLTVAYWYWHFHEYQTVLMVSRKADLVDMRGNSDSLFWKMDFLLRNEPSWLRPEVERKKMHLENLETHSTINGEATTRDMGVGGRRTVVVMDEFAIVRIPGADFKALEATADVTDCRWFNSTPGGTGGAYYKKREEVKVRLRMHWSCHPEKAAGLYTSDSLGNVVVLDETYEYPDDFEFIRDGFLRSPWYDYECARRSQIVVATQLDIDYLGSDVQFFDSDELRDHEEQWGSEPDFEGELRWDEAELVPQKLVERKGGKVHIWRPGSWPPAPWPALKPPVDRYYSMGIDVSQGVGATPSTVSIFDSRERRKVLGLAAPHMGPKEFARYCIVLARLFRGADEEGAYMVWEKMGPGSAFGLTVYDAGYRNIYWATDETGTTRRPTDKPGIYYEGESKGTVWWEYADALGVDFINPDLVALREAAQVVFKPDGTIDHVDAFKGEDPSGSRHNHADRVTADVLAYWGAKMLPKNPELTIEVDMEHGFSLASRRRIRRAKRRKEEEFQW